MVEKLKKRWNIESNWSVIAIFIVFAINGSFAAWVAKPITAFLGLSPETITSFAYWPIRIILIFPIYNLPYRLWDGCLDNLNFSGLLKKSF